MSTLHTPFRVLFLTDQLNIAGGGSNHSLDLIVRSLDQHDVDVDLMTVNHDGGNQLPSSYSFSLGETNLAGDTRLATARNTLDALKRSDADLIHVFEPSLAPVAGLYARSGDTPVVSRLNTYTLFCTNNDVMDGQCYQNCTLRRKIAHSPGPLRDNLGNLPKFTFDDIVSPWILRYVDRFFALSPAVRSVHAANGIPTSNISILPNFFDPEFTDREPNFSTDDWSNLLYVGRLHPKKGVDTLIQALEVLDDPPHVDIVGEGPHRVELETLVADLNLESTVTFHGWVDYDELPTYYRSASLFVHPGNWPEPFGRTILEALQCGCVPVVSDVGGPPWILDHSDLTFPPGDEQALAQKIERLRGSDITGLTGHLQGRLEKFSPGSVVPRLFEEYEQLIN